MFNRTNERQQSIPSDGYFLLFINKATIQPIFFLLLIVTKTVTAAPRQTYTVTTTVRLNFGCARRILGFDLGVIIGRINKSFLLL